MRPSIIAVMATAILVLATPALGASENDRDNCNQTANHDLKIESCTRVLNDRDEPRSNHAIAYNRCGLAWQSKRDLDRAIADFDQAIRLDPTSAGSLQQPWQRLVRPARLRPRHRRLRPGDQA